MNQIGHQCGQSVNLALCPAVFDRHVAPFDVTGFAKSFEKGRDLRLITLGRSDVNKPDHRHPQLLRACSKRPSGRGASNNFDEISPAHGTLLREASDDASRQKLIKWGSQSNAGNVRFGSLADISLGNRHVRFTPERWGNRPAMLWGAEDFGCCASG